MTTGTRYVFDAAQDFHVASRVLEGCSGQRVFPLRSAVVTVAFAVELYLKCLSELTTGQKPRKLHTLVDLYDCLPDSARGRCRQVAPALTDILLQHNNTFVDWRYIFEKQSETFTLDLQSLRQAASALYRVITALQPDWETDAIRNCLLE